MSNLKVLWVDDKPFPEMERRSEKYGISLERVENSEIGIRRLNEDLFNWDFVLLDGRGTKIGNVENLAGAGDMLRELERLKTQRDIPHCIFSAYTEDADVAILKQVYGDIRSFRKMEVKDPLHPYEDLFKYIKEESSKLESRQVQNLYSDVFDAALKLDLPEEHIQSLTSYLKALTFEKCRSLCPGGNELRQIIECICKKLMNFNLIPQECLKGDRTGKRTSEVNITDAVGYLSGCKSAFIFGKRTPFGILDSEGPIICQFMADNLQRALNYTQKDSHDNTPIDKQDENEIIDINKSITEYYNTVANPLFMFSSVLIVCDFIKAIATYLGTHADKNVNIKRAYNLQKDLSITFSKDKDIEYGEGILEKDSNGVFHIGPHIEILPKIYKGYPVPLAAGKKVSIKSITRKDSNRYKYSTTDYILLP